MLKITYLLIACTLLIGCAGNDFTQRLGRGLYAAGNTKIEPLPEPQERISGRTVRGTDGQIIGRID